MLVQFQKSLTALVGQPSKKTFLLAVSGGVDSVVMADIFYKGGIKFAVAHCNFQLRGAESDGDEKFVAELAKKYKAKCFIKKFETDLYAKQQKLSVQMAARELRYAWFNELIENEGFDNLVIAHHADDAIETFFINLLRGTGIAGLHGISAGYEKLVRPLLAFTRKEIEDYAKKEKLTWREDSSNSSDKYERNKIRHHLIPELKKINPDAANAISLTIQNLSETEQVYRKAIEETLAKLMLKREGRTHISISQLQKLETAHLYLYEYIKQYGFNYTQAKEICQALNGQSGKLFVSDSHKIILDRKYLVIEKLDKHISNKIAEIDIEEDGFVNGDIELMFTSKAKPTNFKPYNPPTTASFDYDKLKFPLKIRKWKQGDKFYPLGMNKQKKVSDYLIDNKVSLADKERIYVLLSGNEIVWLIGHRIDDRYKIVPATKKLYICNIVNKD